MERKQNNIFQIDNDLLSLYLNNNTSAGGNFGPGGNAHPGGANFQDDDSDFRYGSYGIQTP